jgi:UDP-glucuronate decarboxylase
MRLLVAGAAGFLGSHLSEKLLRLGYEVIGIDNLYTGSKNNLSTVVSNPRFTFLLHDVTFPTYLEVDGIFNLACPASPIHYQKNPVQTFKTCVVGAINLLGLAKRTGARYLQASTSEVYGDPHISPQIETYWGNVNPIGIRSCYDEGKRAAETLCLDYNRQFDVDIRVARIFNTYGPRMSINDGRVVSNFIVQALRHEPITVFGDGSQTRSFCYFSDLVDGLLSLFFSNSYTHPVNLGNPEEVSVGELANEVIALTGSRSKIVQVNLPSDDPRHRCPDISLARKLLGWHPSVARKDGLELTIDYFRKALISRGG